MPRKRKPKRTPKPRVNSVTKLVSIRLSHEMIEALKGLSEDAGKPYQTVLKELLAEALGLSHENPAKKTVYEAPHLQLSKKRLRR